MERVQKMMSQRFAAIALAVGIAILVGACGSSSSSSSTTSSSSTAATSAATTAASTAGGSTVDVWTAAPIGAPQASAPQSASGVQAAFRYLNSHGGLGSLHQKVAVKVCNTQLTPQGEIQCGQQAVSDPKAIAMIAPIIVISVQPFVAELQKAGLPDVNPSASAPPVFQSPTSFPLNADYLAQAGCAVMVPRAVHATKIGFATTSTPVSIAIQNTAIAAAKKAGFTTVGTVSFPITATDVTPFVSQLAAKNPQVVVLTASPQDIGAWLAAEARLGKTGPTCTGDATSPPEVLAGLGSQASNFYTSAVYPDPTWTGYPMLVQFRQQAAAEAATGDQAASLSPGNDTIEILGGWLGAQSLIQAAAKTSGAITRSTLLTALNHTTATFGANKAVLPPLDFATPNPNPTYSRLFNTTFFLKKWDPATKAFVAVSGVQPVNGDQLIP